MGSPGAFMANGPADNLSVPVKLTDTQTELLAWFRKDAPSLATAYEGAIQLLGQPAFPGRIALIAHVVRDISDRLISILDPQEEKISRVQYEEGLDVIAAYWPEIDALSESALTPSETDTVAVPTMVARHIDNLVKAHRKRRKRPSAHELLFRFLLRKDPGSLGGERCARLAKEFKRIHQWFMSWAHLRMKTCDPPDERELQTQFSGFERMLHSFVGNFFTGKKDLDDILQQANK